MSAQKAETSGVKHVAYVILPVVALIALIEMDVITVPTGAVLIMAHLFSVAINLVNDRITMVREEYHGDLKRLTRDAQDAADDALSAAENAADWQRRLIRAFRARNVVVDVFMMPIDANAYAVEAVLGNGRSLVMQVGSEPYEVAWTLVPTPLSDVGSVSGTFPVDLDEVINLCVTSH